MGIADDLIVHGLKNIEEHAQNSQSVARRPSPSTPKKVVFIGLLVSTYGIDLTEEKVRAVLEAAESPYGDANRTKKLPQDGRL